MYCTKCGNELFDGALYCPKCGASANPEQTAAQPVNPVHSNEVSLEPVSPKSRLASMLLGIFLGEFGIHNFYLGRIVRAVSQLAITVFGLVIYIYSIIQIVAKSMDYAEGFEFEVAGYGLLIGISCVILSVSGIWSLVEWIIIACGKARDGNNFPVKNW